MRSIPQRLGPSLAKWGNYGGALRRGWVHRKAKLRLKRNCDCADSVCLKAIFGYDKAPDSWMGILKACEGVLFFVEKCKHMDEKLKSDVAELRKLKKPLSLKNLI